MTTILINVGSIITRPTNGGVVSSTINEIEDLTPQIDGVMQTFTITKKFRKAKIFYNGRLQNGAIVGTTENTITLDFIPTPGPDRQLWVVYDQDF